MNLRFIETFLWVARLGSFSAAAEKLAATQASVSHRIATLEEELGVSLFDRDSRSVTLTPAGRQAVPRAEEIMRAVGAFRIAIADPERLEGTVSLGTNDVVAHSLLSRIITRVRQRFPGIVIDLQIETSAAIARGLMERRVDFALSMGPIGDSRVVNLDFGSFASVWVASPALGFGGKPLTLRDIATRSLMTFSRDSQPHRWLSRQLGEAGLDAKPISNINSLITMVGLAADGFGSAALPHAVVSEHLTAGTLEVLDVTPVFPAFPHHVSYLELNESPLVKAVAAIAFETAEEAAREGMFVMPADAARQ
ncbi:LysR family transcriptional regulator [Mesorhizobium australicum]|uniref:Transcriptional regulator, LysR family n=1 Tax=Mesorhizobium australicum TaxID=536018 RepID=A0A1X7NHQ1_9HYPH|nr:LysR family transcriptional regulator [Mesorhizobium australicum]SMH36897.1 transcriptional regulator, LysR family [Mesorhizobium australicum]